MSYDPEILEGINKLCAKCEHKCKQFKGVTVVKCPHFTATEKKVKPTQEQGEQNE
jgi:hypothetical protein